MTIPSGCIAPPVALIAFNRPDLTRRTLAAIRAARPSHLFLIADGPRSCTPGDAAACAATREVLEEVDWPCTVTRRYSDSNLGLEANVESGLDWLFARVERAVVLEDDCLADISFFRFAGELLERYRDDPAVWYLTGNGLGLPERRFRGGSYAFSAWASVWGWATWADRWHRHRELLPRDHRRRPGDAAGGPPRRTAALPAVVSTLVTPAGRRHFADAATSSDTVTHGWDVQWWLSIMTDGGLVITPARSMVENVGFGVAGATHTAGSGGDGRVYGAAEAMPFPLVHPPAVVLDREVERELELVLARVGGRTARIARRLVRRPLLRRLLRAVVSSPPAMLVARAISRTLSRAKPGRTG